MTVGIKNDGTVLGISFLSLSETPGLGMKANEDSFKNQLKIKKQIILFTQKVELQQIMKLML